MQDNIAREYKQKQIFEAGIEGDLTGDVTGDLTGDVTGQASENTTQGNGLLAWVQDRLLSIATLAISATAEKFKTTTTSYYQIAGIQYSKNATDNLTFTAADTINTAGDDGDYWGAWLVQINAAGTISTKSVDDDQVYTSEADAIAALPDADADNVALGYIVINANENSSWTANTDDMTDASDCVEAKFVDATLAGLPDAIS